MTDSGNTRVARVDDITGANWTTLGPSFFTMYSVPTGIAIDAASKIYVTDTTYSG